MSISSDAREIIRNALEAAKPNTAVRRALESLCIPREGKLILVAVGKAAWQMSKSAEDFLGDRVDDGIVITKHGHSEGNIGKFEIYEAGHPIPDDDSYRATQRVIEKTESLTEKDTVIFLLSGGGSALFEKPLVEARILEEVTNKLLACGADIVEMNTIRKRLSAVKGGRFAKICAPAQVFSIVLSDIIGDPLDMIASGPAYPDASSSQDALTVLKKYKLSLPTEIVELLQKETPKEIDNVQTIITGSVKQLCKSAEKTCLELGYQPYILSDSLCCTARDAGSFLASIAKFHSDTTRSLAYICGGETVVNLTGKGKGGRNQEIVLSAAKGIAGLENTLVFSVGSDGTDGPTDAAGGYCDGSTKAVLERMGISIDYVLTNNDTYHALKECERLIITGPTGTNVNDLTVMLIKRD